MIDQDQTREWGRRFAAHLCAVWDWLPDEQEAEILGMNVAYAMHHAVAGTYTRPESLATTLLCVPTGQAPHEVYAQAIADARTAVIAAMPDVPDDVLEALNVTNPHPVYVR
ncbi:hypothetical protein [Microbacterium sp. 77mftsu3.1]|uniref:hypothetical protein n=1 Tax=Microbacterium sp. 77mftsu3.1 TaxID=1761802 RepID=UPI0003634159|nr:hypothetical protein [Microbacterium sp. 77mftsu3.1]SDH38297.1 hypothetical protein SAMN04488590_3191 [Microbacterium sp. 77mftsu3.1]